MTVSETAGHGLTASVLWAPASAPTFEGLRSSFLERKLHEGPEAGALAWSVVEEARLAKAAMLYADKVVVCSERLSLLLDRGRSTRVWTAVWPPEPVAAALECVFSGASPPLPGRTDAEVQAIGALNDLRIARASGLLELSPWLPDPKRLVIDEPCDIPVVDAETFEAFGEILAAATRPTRRRAYEGMLATSLLLGELEVYPDASVDVLLDVRDRLAATRSHFQAAMSLAAEQLDARVRDGEPLGEVIAELRRREMDPAMTQIAQELQELGVVDTLLRITSDRTMVAGTVAAGMALAVAAAAGMDLAALKEFAAAAIAMGPSMMAATAKETRTRRRLLRELAARPYWLLTEVRRQFGRA